MVRHNRLRLAAIAAIALVAPAAVARLYFVTNTIPPQSPPVAQVERQLKDQLRRGWLRVVLADRVLEVRVNGEAILGYTGKAARLETVDTAVVRGLATKALDLYAPPKFGPAPGLDSVRIRLRHSDYFGPIPYQIRGKDFAFSTTSLRP